MIYYSFKQNTFLDSELHEIDDSAVEISTEQHLQLLDAINSGCLILPDLTTTPPRPSEHHEWNGKAWTIKRELAKQLAAQSLQSAKNDKIAELNALAQQVVNKAAGTNKLPEFEIQSWALQAAEAKAWAQNPEVATPILDQIATARGVPADVLKQAALRKTQAYEALTALVAGQRQALQTQIELAKSLDDLNAIEIAFRLPETGGNP